MVRHQYEEQKGGGFGRLQRGDLRLQTIVEADTGSPIAIQSSFKEEVLHGSIEGHRALLRSSFPSRFMFLGKEDDSDGTSVGGCNDLVADAGLAEQRGRVYTLPTTTRW